MWMMLRVPGSTVLHAVRKFGLIPMEVVFERRFARHDDLLLNLTTGQQEGDEVGSRQNVEVTEGHFGEGVFELHAKGIGAADVASLELAAEADAPMPEGNMVVVAALHDSGHGIFPHFIV